MLITTGSYKHCKMNSMFVNGDWSLTSMAMKFIYVKCNEIIYVGGDFGKNDGELLGKKV